MTPSLQPLRQFAEAHSELVTRRESTRFPGLFVIKYKNKVFYDNLWTPELLEMRGLVVDADWNLYCYPFTKIYNYKEQGATIPDDEAVTAVVKVNGFLGCATKNSKYGLIVSTTGSLDSEFCDMARKWLAPLEPCLVKGHTYMFEIVDPEDPHIIAEKPGAYLIGCRQLWTGNMLNEEDLDFVAQQWWKDHPEASANLKRPQHMTFKFGDILKSMPKVQHEGYVIHGNGVTLKIKSPHYLITKFLARKRADKLDVMLDAPHVLKQTVDEEFYPLIDHLVYFREIFSRMDEQQRIAFIKEFLTQ